MFACWDVFTEVTGSVYLCVPPTTPLPDVKGKSEGRWEAVEEIVVGDGGGHSHRLMVHSEREHRPTVAAP